MGSTVRLRDSNDPEDPATGLAWRAALDDTQTPTDVVDLLALAALADGRHRFARHLTVKRLPRDSDLVPLDGVVARRVDTDTYAALLVTGHGWTLRLVRNRAGDGYGWATAETPE